MARLATIKTLSGFDFCKRRVEPTLWDALMM